MIAPRAIAQILAPSEAHTSNLAGARPASRKRGCTSRCPRAPRCAQVRAMADDGLVVEIWNDPVWTPALRTLEDEGDARPLAQLFRDESKQPPPFEVVNALGKMLDPPQGYVGRHLKIITPTRARNKAIGKLVEDIKLRQRVLEAQKTLGKLEAAVSAIMKETGLSRAKIFNALRLNEREIVLKLSLILGEALREKVSSKKGPKS